MKKSITRISHRKWQQEDEIIKDAFQVLAEQIEAPDYLKKQIDNRLLEESEKEEHRMRQFSIKKTVIAVAAACLLVGTVCVAASGLKSYVGHSSNIPDYTDFQDMEKAENEVGYEIRAVESFSNGFQLKGIHIGDITMQNEDGTAKESQKNIKLAYERGNETILVDSRRLFAGETPESFSRDKTPDKALQCGDITVRFSRNTYKAVPPDYEITEEEKKLVEEGSLMIGYGSKEVQTNEYFYTMFIKDNILYEIAGFDLSESADGLLNMCREIIENGK